MQPYSKNEKAFLLRYVQGMYKPALTKLNIYITMLLIFNNASLNRMSYVSKCLLSFYDNVNYSTFVQKKFKKGSTKYVFCRPFTHSLYLADDIKSFSATQEQRIRIINYLIS